MAGQYVAINIARTARDRVRTLTFTLTGVAGRRVTMSEAIEAACSAAEQLSADELAAHLPEPEDETS